jgi:uncharacterized protein (PEP-CTERM system associated)
VLTTTFGSALTYTDVRNSPFNNGNDVALQLSPGFQLFSRSGRVRGSAIYSLGLIRRTGREDERRSQVQNNLNANFTAEAVPGWLYVDAVATASQSSLSAFGQQDAPGSIAQDNSNSTELGTLSLTPRISGQLGSFATYDARFQASASNARRSIVGDSTNTTTNLAINSASSGSVFGWGLQATRQRTAFRAGRATVDERAFVRLSLTPSPEVRFALRGGQERSDIDSADSRSTSTTGFDMQWAPNERTQASLTSDRRIFGRSHQVTLSHRLSQSALRFTSTQDSSGGGSASGVGQPLTLYQLYFVLLASEQPDPVLRDQLVRERLLNSAQDPNTVVGGGFVTSAVTLQRRQDLAWSYVGRRLSLSVQGFSSRSSLLDNPSQLPDDGPTVQRGYVSAVSYRLTPTAAASITGSRTMTRATLTRGGTDLKSLALSITEQLGRRTNVSLAARYSVFNSPIQPYRETSLTASLNMRF